MEEPSLSSNWPSLTDQRNAARKPPATTMDAATIMKRALTVQAFIVDFVKLFQQYRLAYDRRQGER
jgi:hypothetical protein